MKISISNYESSVLFISLLYIVLGLTFWFYSYALTADFKFDDIANLTSLAHLSFSDRDRLLDFVFGGTKFGGLGRAIAYASFALQAPYWPSHPETFIFTNVLIHLINGSLIAWVALRLHRIIPTLTCSSHGFTLSLAAIWLVQPLLASASLLVVQRMTTLAATFMLAGMVAYLAGRESLGRGDPKGWLLMIGGSGLGTLLAVFTKEIGALLPLYLWVFEVTLLRNDQPSPWIKPWRFVLLTPGLLLFVYWAFHWSDLATGMASRPFDIVERLFSESRILAKYFFLIFCPVRAEFGPFHDDYLISHGLLNPPSTLACILVWLAVIFFAILKRERFPLFAFGVGWFLVGQLLESTVFNLELYFEHRNYLPAIGPLAVLCILLWRIPAEKRLFPLTAFLVYFGLQAFVLRENTLIWGSPRLAAELWVAKHPSSERARQHLAQQLLLAGDYTNALTTIRDGFARNPASTGLALQTIQMRCALDQDVSSQLNEVLPTLQHGERSYAAIDALRKLMHKLHEQPCPGFDAKTMHSILTHLLANRKFSSDPDSLAELHILKTRLAVDEGDLDATIRHLESAFQAVPDIDTATLIIGYLNSAGLNDVALSKIPDFRARVPVNPILKRKWDLRLNGAQSSIEAELQTKSEQPLPSQ